MKVPFSVVTETLAPVPPSPPPSAAPADGNVATLTAGVPFAPATTVMVPSELGTTLEAAVLLFVTKDFEPHQCTW